jgi:hypothetical protein
MSNFKIFTLLNKTAIKDDIIDVSNQVKAVITYEKRYSTGQECQMNIKYLMSKKGYDFMRQAML